jgi:hypothetical protein
MNPVQAAIKAEAAGMKKSRLNILFPEKQRLSQAQAPTSPYI